MTTEH